MIGRKVKLIKVHSWQQTPHEVGDILTIYTVISEILYFNIMCKGIIVSGPYSADQLRYLNNRKI